MELPVLLQKKLEPTPIDSSSTELSKDMLTQK